MDNLKIGYKEAIAILSLTMINKIILNLPKTLISSTGSSTWINIVYISLLMFAFIWLIVKLFKNFSTYDILDISEYIGGKIFKNILGFLYIILILIVPTFVLRNFCETLQLIYFKNSPLLYLFLFFLISTAITNKCGLKALAKTSLIIFPIILFSIIIIFISTITVFVPERIFPILGYGINETFIKGALNIYGYSGLLYLFLLIPLLKKGKEFKKISYVSLFICFIFLFFSVLSILLVFSFSLTSDETISIYLITRNIQYGSFFQRTDAIFILIWILSTLSYISVACFFANYIFCKITTIKISSPVIYSIISIILGCALIPRNYQQFNTILELIFKYVTIVLGFGISLLVLIIANIKKSKELKKELLC